MTLTDAGSLSHRIRLTEQKEDGGIFEIEEAVKDRASTYGSTATGIANTNVPVNAAGLIGPTLFAAMNLPQLRTQDNSQGMYIGAAGILTGWPGATILMSVDGGASYDTVLTCLEPTIMGTLTADITATGTPLSVHVFGGSLASATAAQVLTGLNASAIITSNVSEIVAYETATATATGYYNLTVLTRFMKATVAVAHVSGDQFIDLNTAYFLPINSNLAGTTLYFKAVGIGLSADSVTAVTYVYNPYELPGEHQRIDGNGDLRIDANSDQRITA